MKKFWFSLPGWAQGVIAVAGTAVVVGGAAYAVIQLNKRANSENTRAEVNATESEVKKLENAGQKATLSKVQLESLSNQVDAAFNGATEDEQAIYRIFANVNNDVDVLNLRATYGSRTTGYWPWTSYTGTLSQQIAHYFDPTEIKALNDLLARKKITYRF